MGKSRGDIADGNGKENLDKEGEIKQEKQY